MESNETKSSCTAKKKKKKKPKQNKTEKKTTIHRDNTQHREWEKMFENYASFQGLICTIYKNLEKFKKTKTKKIKRHAMCGASHL